MRKNMNKIIPGTVICILVFIFVMLIGGKVYAGSLEQAECERREQMESIYITTIREELKAAGFDNSGVNMTKATNAEGEWEYTVVIYHRSFAWMDDLEQCGLEKRLADMGSDTLGKISLDLLASYQ